MKSIVDFDTIKDIDIDPIGLDVIDNNSFTHYGMDISNERLGSLIKSTSEESIDKILRSTFNHIDTFNTTVSTEGFKDWANKVKDFIAWIMKQIDKLILLLKKIYIEAKIIISKMSNRVDKCVNDTFDFLIFSKDFYNEPRAKCYNLFSIGGCLHSNIDYILNNMEKHISDSLRVCLTSLSDLNSEYELPRLNHNNISNYNYIINGKGYTVVNNTIVNEDLEFMKDFEYTNIINKKDMSSILSRLDKYYRNIINLDKLYNEIKYKNKEIMRNISDIKDPTLLEKIKLYGGTLPNNYLAMYNELGKNVGWVVKRLISFNPTSPAELRIMVGGVI